MAEWITIRINDRSVQVPAGISVAVALLQQGAACRTSVTGEPREPLCGMGICYECRVTINGIPGQLSCQTLCADGMEVCTHA